MTLERLFDMGMVKDKVLDHMTDKIECFTWQDDNKLYIDVK